MLTGKPIEPSIEMKMCPFELYITHFVVGWGEGEYCYLDGFGEGHGTDKGKESVGRSIALDSSGDSGLEH